MGMKRENLLMWILILGSLAIAAMLAWRYQDQRETALVSERLARSRAPLPQRFDPALVADLPEPARRYFNYVIRPGAPLHAVTTIDMRGELGLGTRDAPDYQPMRAHQVLAAPHGLIWQVDAGRGWMRISGSDGMAGDQSWTRFWLWNLLPLVREGGSRDHLRSTLGRVVAEAAFWSPAALLPQNKVAWSAVDTDTARATITHLGMTQTVDIRVEKDGQPSSVSLPRWTSANPDKTYRLQPFGGYLSDFRDTGGYRLPFRVEGGNFFGTKDYFPFYKAEVLSLRIGGGEP